MLPSEKLRLLISQIYKIDLEKYAWSPELKELIFRIQLDKYLEETLDYLGEAYSLGFNIGHCGLTSRYFVRGLENANLYYGILPILAGTKNSPTGNHAWVVFDGMLIDPTLMICVPEDMASELGYIPHKIIAQGHDKILSDYDTYESEFYNLNNDPNFNDSLILIRKNNI